jgi:hypothetical protein
MEIRVRVDDQFSKQLQDTLGTKKTTEIAKAALTLLNWAATQKSKGRLILSGDENGENLHELALPILDGIQRTKPAPAEIKVTLKAEDKDAATPWQAQEAGAVKPRAGGSDAKQVVEFYYTPPKAPTEKL